MQSLVGALLCPTIRMFIARCVRKILPRGFINVGLDLVHADFEFAMSHHFSNRSPQVTMDTADNVAVENLLRPVKYPLVISVQMDNMVLCHITWVLGVPDNRDFAVLKRGKGGVQRFDF